MRKRIDRSEDRRKAAQEMNEKWRKLTPQQQLAVLDDRLGKDQGAKRQRARLHKQISEGAA